MFWCEHRKGSLYCCVLRGPGGERIVDVPGGGGGGTELEIQI